MKFRFFVITIIFSSFSFGQVENYLEGTDFWLGFMENIESGGADSDIAIASNSGATGTIEIPASGWSQPFVVGPGGSLEVNLPTGLTQPSGGGIYPYAVHILADDTISVYAINRTDASDDATMIKPKKALGHEYYIGTWHEPAPMNDLSEFIIVSTADETTVEITLPGGGSFIVDLDEGDLYQHQLNGDLSGTHIQSICAPDGKSHPIAVFAGVRSTNVGGTSARDHLFEQMYPINDWGTSFNLIPLPYADDYFISVLASRNGTIATINGTDYDLDAGEFVRLNQIGPGYATSNFPISIQLFIRGSNFLSFTNLDGDPIMINVSPDDQGVTDTRFYSFDLEAFSFDYLQYITNCNVNNKYCKY